MASDAPHLVKRAKDVLKQPEATLDALQQALEALTQANTSPYVWPDQGLGVLKICYNLSRQFFRRSCHAQVVACCDQILLGLGKALGGPEVFPTLPHHVQPLDSVDSGWAFLAAWAFCFRGRCLSSEQSTESVLQYVIQQCMPWVVHYVQVDPKQAAQMQGLCLQAFHAGLLPKLRESPVADLGLAIGSGLSLLQLPVAGGAHKHAAVWAGILLDRGKSMLLAYTRAVAALVPDLNDDDAVANALCLDPSQHTEETSRYLEAQGLIALGYQLLVYALTKGQDALPESICGQARAVVDVCTWMGHYPFCVFGLRLLCAHYRLAIKTCKPIPDNLTSTLITTLNELARLLTFLGYVDTADRVHRESRELSEVPTLCLSCASVCACLRIRLCFSLCLCLCLFVRRACFVCMVVIVPVSVYVLMAVMSVYAYAYACACAFIHEGSVRGMSVLLPLMVSVHASVHVPLAVVPVPVLMPVLVPLCPCLCLCLCR